MGSFADRTGAGAAEVRGRITCAAATRGTGCPTARWMFPTGGPNEPLREGRALGPPSGRAVVTIPAVACVGTAARGIGCVKCCSRTATQAGWR